MSGAAGPPTGASVMGGATRRLAAVLRLTARPLLAAQQRAWESCNHPGTLVAGALARSLIAGVGELAHIDNSSAGTSVVMHDGEELTIFRQLHLDAPDQPAALGEFRVRFHARMPPRLNQWFSWLTIPLFAGLPGFRDKTWLVNEAAGVSASIYHWQTIDDALRYAQSPALAFMTRRSLPGSTTHWAGPASDQLSRPWPPDDY